MIKVGIKNNEGNRGYSWKGSLNGIRMGMIGNTAIILALVICILITAPMPVSARSVEDAEPLPATEQPATCPCKRQSNTQQASAAVPPVAAADAEVLNQLFQSSYSPSDTAPQAIGYAPQYSPAAVAGNGANLNTVEPVSVQNSAGATKATGATPTSEFSNLFSQWINNEIGSNVPGYNLRDPTNSQMFGISPIYTTNNQMLGIDPLYATDDQTSGINTVFQGWQVSPINLVQAPMQLNWLNGLMW